MKVKNAGAETTGKFMTNKSRTYVLTGSASGIGRATKELLESQDHQVIGVDLRNADVIADLSTPAGREVMVHQVTKKSGGKVDALLAVAGVDAAGPATIAIIITERSQRLKGFVRCC